MPNIIPTLSSPAISTPPTSNARRTFWGGAPLFNYAAGEFLFDGTGNLVIGTHVQSLVQWIRASLSTIKYKWSIYQTPSLGYFGCELGGMIGKSFDDGVKITLAKKFAYDALVNDSRIRSVQVDATVQDDQLYVYERVIIVSGEALDFQQSWTLG